MNTATKNRIEGYDLARALAILGMVIVNFKISMGADTNGSAWLVRLCGLIEGKAAATFVILAGVGISLMTKKALESNDGSLIMQNRLSLIKRAVLLFVIGLLYTPIWSADILHFYGVFILCASFLFTFKDYSLWLFSVLAVAVFYLFLFTLDYEAGWDWQTVTYHGFWTAKGMIRHLFFNGFHPVFPWVAFILIGIWLGRRDLSNKIIRRRVMLIASIILLATESLSYLIIDYYASLQFNSVLMEDVVALYGTKPMPPSIFYLLSAGSISILIICLSVMLTEKANGLIWLKPWIYTGQLSLTLYIAHVVIGMSVLEVLGLFQNQTLEHAVAASIIFFICGMLFSLAWRLRFKRGPLEWILRKLT